MGGDAPPVRRQAGPVTGDTGVPAAFDPADLAALLDDAAGLPPVLAHAVARAAREVTHPADIVVARFDSSI